MGSLQRPSQPVACLGRPAAAAGIQKGHILVQLNELLELGFHVGNTA